MPVVTVSTGTFNGSPGTSAGAGLAAGSGAGTFNGRPGISPGARLAAGSGAGLDAAAPGFILGTTKPDSSNTGYGVLGYTAGTLTDVTPASPYVVTLSTDGAVYEGKRVHGIIEITGNNITVQGCHVVGHLNIPYPGGSDYGLISSSGTGNVIQYNELTQWDANAGSDNSAGFNGTLDTYWMVGVLMTGGSCTVNRCDIHDVNDATYCTAGAHTIQGCYLHDPMFRNDDGDQSGSSPAYWSHNDAFQCMGGAGHVFDGNAIDWKFSDDTGMNRSGTGSVGSFGTGNPNTSSTVQQSWPNAHGVLLQAHNANLGSVMIKRNWFRYGSCPIRFAPNTFTPGAVTVINNRFTPDQAQEFSQYVQIRIDPASGTGGWGSPAPTIDVSGGASSNVYSDDSDTPLADRGTAINALTGTSVQVSAYNSGAHTGHVPLSLTP